ncbi:MAG: TonB-dependent receptor plug domain-containing protein [Verrucomicrobia bacterium]|nr:TonB-dependent receptor plug domain-containing protein [Verrucomicrobiota bacterium]
MNLTSLLRPAKFLAFGILLNCFFSAHIVAQENTNEVAVAIPESEGNTTNEEDEMVFLMNDFVVSAEDDQGYYSANTLAGTRTNELTKNIPMTISTVNKELIEDFGMQTLADMGNYVPSIESEGSAYNNSEIRFRGFVARNSLFEFMPRYSPLDYYIVERADIIRGANSLIYGQADPGGKVNIISKVANLSKNETRVGIEVGDHKFIKTNLDTNIVLNDQAAVRVMATDSHREFTQDHRFQDYTGVALEASYLPTKTRACASTSMAAKQPAPSFPARSLCKEDQPACPEGLLPIPNSPISLRTISSIILSTTTMVPSARITPP